MKKLIIGSLIVVMLLVGTSIFSSKPSAIAGSSVSPAAVGDVNSTFFMEDALTEANQKRLDEVQPAPSLDKSLERANLIRRLKFLNDENRIGYIYILSDTGTVISEYTIKGKPSSLNSFLTNSEQVRCQDVGYNVSDKGCSTISSPDLDGSYGDNPEGIFFFTTDDTYVEWSGKYIYSSQSMNINTPVALTRNVK